MNEFKFELGVQARSTVTGFAGTITARGQWLHATNSYLIKPWFRLKGVCKY